MFLEFLPTPSLDPNNTPPQTTATGVLFPGLIIYLQQHANFEVKRSCLYALIGLFQSTLLVSVFLAIFLLLQSLREAEVGSTLWDSDCNNNIARNVHFRVCHTRQQYYWCNLCHNGTTKLHDGLPEELPSVKAP